MISDTHHNSYNFFVILKLGEGGGEKKNELFKEYFVLTMLCSSLYCRFMASTKKVFMNSGLPQKLRIHRAFNSMWCEELLNLQKSTFSSQTFNRKIMPLENIVPYCFILTDTSTFSYSMHLTVVM